MSGPAGRKQATTASSPLTRIRLMLLLLNSWLCMVANSLGSCRFVVSQTTLRHSFRRQCMNRRVIVLAGTLLVAGFFAAHGVLSQTDAAVKRRVINLPEGSPQAAYSSAILTGDTLYISGNIGFDPKTGKPPEKIEDEIKNLL